MKAQRKIGFLASPTVPRLPVALTIQGQPLKMGCLGPDLLLVDRADLEKVLAVLTNSTWTISEPPAPADARNAR